MKKTAFLPNLDTSVRYRLTHSVPHKKCCVYYQVGRKFLKYRQNTVGFTLTKIIVVLTRE